MRIQVLVPAVITVLAVMVFSGSFYLTGGTHADHLQHEVYCCAAPHACAACCDGELRKDDSLSHSTSFVVFPQDCNANPPMLFGGKIMAEMDRTAAITVRRFLYKSPLKVRDAVTVAVDKVAFLRSAKVKDLIVVHGEVVDTGAKSVTVAVTVSRDTAEGRETLVTGSFVFAAFDLEKGVAVPHGMVLAPRDGK